MKKLVILVVCILLALNFNVIADNNLVTADMSLNELEEKSGISKDELVELKARLGDEFDIMITDYINMREEMEEDANTYSVNNTRMTSSEFQTLKNQFLKGNILISKDQSSGLWVLSFNHGHAAILYDANTTVEALGSDYLSDDYDVSWWSSLSKVRLYMENVTTGTTAQNNAGNFAYNNLQGFEYSILPTCSNTEKLNCATLVWHAYNSTGVVFDTYFGSCIPKTLVEDDKTTMKAHVNWGGDGNTW